MPLEKRLYGKLINRVHDMGEYLLVRFEKPFNQRTGVRWLAVTPLEYRRALTTRYVESGS